MRDSRIVLGGYVYTTLKLGKLQEDCCGKGAVSGETAPTGEYIFNAHQLTGNIPGKCYINLSNIFGNKVVFSAVY